MIQDSLRKDYEMAVTAQRFGLARCTWGAMFYALAGLPANYWWCAVTLLLLAAAVDVAIRCGAEPDLGGGVDRVIGSVRGVWGLGLDTVTRWNWWWSWNTWSNNHIHQNAAIWVWRLWSKEESSIRKKYPEEEIGFWIRNCIGWNVFYTSHAPQGLKRLPRNKGERVWGQWLPAACYTRGGGESGRAAGITFRISSSELLLGAKGI